jgi:hypothetical protein
MEASRFLERAKANYTLAIRLGYCQIQLRPRLWDPDDVDFHVRVPDCDEWLQLMKTWADEMGLKWDEMGLKRICYTTVSTLCLRAGNTM